MNVSILKILIFSDKTKNNKAPGRISQGYELNKRDNKKPKYTFNEQMNCQRTAFK